MNELRKILWNLKDKEQKINTLLSKTKNESDTFFWVGEALANSHAMTLVQRAIRKVDCIS